jgi:hypothetical protein
MRKNYKRQTISTWTLRHPRRPINCNLKQINLTHKKAKQSYVKFFKL